MKKVLFFLQLTAAAIVAQGQSPRISFYAPQVYPEGVTYSPKTKLYYVSSVKTGTIGTVTRNGEYKEFYRDSTLKSTFGMKIDAKGILWVCAGDPNYSKFKDSTTFKKMIRVVGIELSSGKKVSDINLSALYNGKHFLNDIAIDKTGNSFLTDSFSPVVYKIDNKGHASVFAQDSLFSSIDIGLNGIAWNPRGFLVVANNSDGSLLKIDLKDPKKVTRIKVPVFFVGADGLLWNSRGNLVVVQNKGVNKVYELSSSDNWTTASVLAATSVEDRFKQPSTCTLVGDSVYVLNSKLNELSNPTMPPSKEFSIQLAEFKSQ